MNGIPLLAIPPTVTTTDPVVAPDGTGTVILPEAHAVGVADVPLNVTVLVPCVLPNAVPVMVIGVVTTPSVLDRLAIAGPGWTVKFTPTDELPLTVTTIFPLVAPAGGFVTICVELHDVGFASMPLNVTVPGTPNGSNPYPFI